MDIIVWIIVAAVAALVAWALGANRTRGRYRDVLENLAESLKWDDELPTRGTELPGVGSLRAALRENRGESTADAGGEAGAGAGSAAGTEAEEVPASARTRTAAPEAGDELVRSALGQMRSYLEEGVEEPLREGLDEGEGALRGGVQDALIAMEDLYFYLREVPEAREPVDLNEVAREAGDEYRSEWDADVDVHVPERPTRVSVNEEAMLDALYLVLHNAHTFGEGAEIEVVVRYQDGECWLVVRDRGEGFTDEALDRAFDPFYTTTRLGLGLGLYHVKKIVQAMGGRVAVRNWRRGGGQVEIVLPEAGKDEE